MGVISKVPVTTLLPRKRMSATKRVLVGNASVLVIGGAGAVLAPATPAVAVVLVNYDGGTIHLGQSLQVGVWYQQFSGGPRQRRSAALTGFEDRGAHQVPRRLRVDSTAATAPGPAATAP